MARLSGFLLDAMSPTSPARIAETRIRIPRCSDWQSERGLFASGGWKSVAIRRSNTLVRRTCFANIKTKAVCDGWRLQDNVKIEGTPVYLDVEGLPDRDFYYLIGLRIGHGESAVQHSLWADTSANKGKSWHKSLRHEALEPVGPMRVANRTQKAPRYFQNRPKPGLNRAVARGKSARASSRCGIG